jgi:hypothetical protein
LSVVPPRPPAVATVRSYWTLAEPNWNRCRRLALAADVDQNRVSFGLQIGYPLRFD